MPSVGEPEVKDTEVSQTRKCAGCEKPAGTLQCPKCLQLNILDSYFCDQDCFKRNWVCLKVRQTNIRILINLSTSNIRPLTHLSIKRGSSILELCVHVIPRYLFPKDQYRNISYCLITRLLESHMLSENSAFHIKLIFSHPRKSMACERFAR
jgi:hypothetical protein